MKKHGLVLHPWESLTSSAKSCPNQIQGETCETCGTLFKVKGNELQRCQNTRSPLERTVNEKETREKPITWDDTGLVMFLDGYGWTALPMNGRVEHVCLGKEDDVKAILSGQKPITEARGEREQMALREILDTKEDLDARPTEARGRNPKRKRLTGVIRHKQTNPGRSKVRQRLPHRQVNPKS